MVDGVTRQQTGGLPPLNIRDGSKLPDSGIPAPRTPAPQLSVTRFEAGPPPLDRGKIDAIRSEIAAGGYPVDALKIADAMLAADLPPRA